MMQFSMSDEKITIDKKNKSFALSVVMQSVQYEIFSQADKWDENSFIVMQFSEHRPIFCSL